MAGRKKVKAAWQDDALQAVRTLKAGGVILHATDTVWGLACDSSNPEAVAKLRAIKERGVSPILVLASDDGMIQNHVEEVPDAAWDLYDNSDRPTTIVLPKGRGVDPSILSESKALGIRKVDEPWCQFVIRGLNRPIASSSANLSGEPTPAEFSTINQQIIDAVDYVSTHRRNEKITSTPSFMVEFDDKARFKILRK